MGFDKREQQGMEFCMGGSIIIDGGLLFCVSYKHTVDYCNVFISWLNSYYDDTHSQQSKLTLDGLKESTFSTRFNLYIKNSMAVVHKARVLYAKYSVVIQ